MGNASPEVQRAADFVTDSNRDDGFAHAIERFILGGGRSRRAGWRRTASKETAHGSARSRRIENLACPRRRRRHARH